MAREKINYSQYLSRWEESVNSDENPLCPISIQKNIKEGSYEVIPCITFLWDIKKMKYLYFSKNVLEYTGYTAEEFLTKGPYFTFSLVHPEDLYEIVENVQKAQIDFLRTLAAGECSNYKFTCNYRIRRSDGIYIHILLQEIILQADTKGNPLLSFGTVSDITNLKKDININFLIAKFDADAKQKFNFKMYSFAAQERLLSERELQVLRLILEGCNTNEIAQKLCISPHTVKNHRKHMLARTQVKNMPELIRYAMKSGLI